MIIMNLEVNNFFGFDDFKINFSYPKKIVNSTIPNEFLVDKPNFRYKKVNIIMGSNASGKTSLGKMIEVILKFLKTRNILIFLEYIKDGDEDASFSMDFLLDSSKLYRLDFKNSIKSKPDRPLFMLSSAKINKNDSYESCLKKLKLHNFNEEWDKIFAPYNWLFLFTDTNLFQEVKFGKEMDINVFNSVIKSLDNSIIDVTKSNEFDDGYIINSRNGKVAVQNGEVIRNNILSSGTQAGIDISYLVSSIINGNHSLYYCDEKFSFVHSDVEEALLSLMISKIKDGCQLFFTSHNLELLDLNLPLHSFTFLRNEDKIEPVYTSDFIKKNDISLKNQVKNDVFNISPNLDEIFKIEERYYE